MNNLTTRKIVLGMLMTLVLTFSVQGIADALTFGTSRSGDLATVSPNEPFTIRFSVNLRSPVAENLRTSRGSTTDIEYASGARTRPATPSPLTANYTQTTDTGYTAGDTHYYTVTTTAATDGFTLTTNTRNWLTESAAYDYNNESVSITSTPTLMKGNTAVTSLVETASESDERLTSSVTLTGSHGTAGAFDIVITDNTVADDYPDDTAPTERASITFTVFVVDRNPSAAETEWGFTGLTSTDENYKVGGDDFTDDAITTASTSENVRVEYSVIEGSGRLYVQRAPTRKTSAARTISTSSAAIVHLDMNGSTNKVRASISGAAPIMATFIFGYPAVTIVSGNGQEGAFGGRLDDPLVVKVTDGRGRALSGLAADFATTATGAMFIPVEGTTVHINATGALVGAIADSVETQTATATRPMPAGDILVQTDSSGEAKTYFQLGTTTTETSQTVTVMAGGSSLIVPPNFRFTAGAGTRRPTLFILSGNNQRTDENGDIEDPLIVIVRRDGNLIPDEQVTFRTSKGTLEGQNQTNDGPASGKRVYGTTDGSGRAQVTYFQDPGEGSDTVTATISGSDYERTVTFGINGGRTTGGGTSNQQQEEEEEEGPGARLAASSTSVSGAAGSTQTVTIGAVGANNAAVTGVTITLDPNSTFITAGGSYSSSSGSSPFEVTLTLPSTAGTYSFSAGAVGYTGVSISVTVTGGLGTLNVAAIGAAVNQQQTIEVTVRNAAGIAPTGAVPVSVSGAVTRTVDTLGGSGRAIITIPATATYTLTLSATGYATNTVTLSPTGQQVGTTTPTPAPTPAPTPTPTPTPTVSEPSSISISGPAVRTGVTVNQQLDAPLLVQVLDADGSGVEDARVIFRVRTGRGKLSERGNGRAVAAQTDARGFARANYTPMSASSTVEVEARGVTQTVTFTITTGAAPASGTTPRETDTAPGTISPVVHVGAAQRPPMLWVDGGKIYALVGKDVQEFASGVDNALNIAVGGGKVYWTEKTGDSAGTINSANLNGSGVTELASILAVPMGIAVDAVNSALYWTNSRGRIQTADLDGSGITNVIPGGLEGVMDLALAGGNAYWTQSGNVRFVNLRGQKQIRNISTGTDTAGSLAIGGGKVYWTEMTGESGGTVNSANLNGTGATELASILAAPSGIAVDGSRSKLYWGNARGRIQSANLDGSKISNVVSGLESPGDMVLSNSISAPTTTTPRTTTTTTASNKYDVNGDGSVDSKDVDALIVAVAAGVTDAKYDVNGDGKVDIFDVSAVSSNRSDGAAAAPALLGTKLSIVQIDRLQEQIDLLIASNDRSPDAMRILTYLQQLIVMARPEKTQLLANYPNPFNPETWIPYELATDTTVKITIYNTQGVVIRTLELGHQSSGYYTGRDRAAYWDGRNALGEQVASGIYFYQFETDDMSSMRKMVILK